MKVVRTPQVEAQIKKYKRFLETAELANHSVMMNDRFYFSVQYWIWGKVNGYLILCKDGEVVPREEAIPVSKLFTFHNLSVNHVFQTLGTAMEKPVWMYEQKRDALQAILPHYQGLMDNQTEAYVKTFLDVCQFVADSQPRLRALYEKAMGHHNQMMARGYAIQEDDDVLRDILAESDFLLYERLRIQYKAWAVLEHLITFFKKQKPLHDQVLQQQRRKLINLMQTFSDDRHKKEAENSIRKFENWTVNTPVVFQSVDQYKEICMKANHQFFQHELLPLLRNP